jgi:hypothetical protein
MQLEALIKIIKTNPVLFIGDQSISKFAAFIRGYIWAMNEHVQQEECTEKNDLYPNGELLRQYNMWLTVRYQETSSYGWDDILLSIAGSEEKALALFWETWEEFLADPHREENVEQWYAWMYEK